MPIRQHLIQRTFPTWVSTTAASYLFKYKIKFRKETHLRGEVISPPFMMVTLGRHETRKKVQAEKVEQPHIDTLSYSRTRTMHEAVNTSNRSPCVLVSVGSCVCTLVRRRLTTRAGCFGCREDTATLNTNSTRIHFFSSLCTAICLLAII